MRSAVLLGLLGATMLSVMSEGALAQCAPGAIGTSRRIEVDTGGGPRFGNNQYPSADLLKPGEIVLTFDDGPHKQLTPVVLDILDQHCAKATFFMVGQRAVAYPGLVRDVARRGHSIATHTWSHRNLKELSAEGAASEIELGISAVQKALGAPAAPFFRFPYLNDPAHATQHLRQRHTGIFSIDIDSYDFRTRSPTVVMRNVMQQIGSKGRGIILFHDIQPSTAGALGALLSDLKAGGYRVVHLVPKRSQTTLAEFDRRVGQDHPIGKVAELPVPVSQRAAVMPAWEPARVVTTPPARVAVGQQGPGGPSGDAYRPAPLPVAPLRAAQERPIPRPRDSDDWRSTIFRNW